MEFQLKHAATGSADIPNSTNINLRFFDQKGKFGFPTTPYSQEQLDDLNQLKYFSENIAWESSNPITSRLFLLRLLFGKMLQDSPSSYFGLICNAVGGSTTESWIDRYTLEHHTRLVDILSNWSKNDNIQPWVRTQDKT